ncbi:MAG: mechanosensitive ion channel [Gammaproteobacteria bacterium]|nr:mechanosensitive ion channel [Gammaproteobacteria bacterium]
MDLGNLVSTYVIPWGLNIVFALITFIVGRIVAKIVVNVIGKILRRTKMEEILVEFVSSIVNAALMLFVVIASLNQLGVDTTSLIALLGAAGLAVGLALQGSLQNFAAGVMLLIFRPFKAGDFIEAGGVAGIVETISIFTTKMRTGDNKEVIVPNGSIFGGNITNFSARDTRRIDMVFGIGYDADIKKAKDIMQKLIDEDERILKDPAPLIAVSELADSSVNFVVRPWVNSGDFWAVKFDLTERIKLAFDENGISIPFPQMDVHLNKVA